MDKASASGAGDCGFESHQGRSFFPTFFFIPRSFFLYQIALSTILIQQQFSPYFSHSSRCLLRVLDTFGTEPVFNYKKWKPEKDDHNHDYGHTWGNWELNPRQFWTMYRKHLIVVCSLWSHFTPSFPSYISLLPFFYILPLFLYPSSLCFSLPHSHPVKFYSWSLSFTHTCSLTCISRLR